MMDKSLKPDMAIFKVRGIGVAVIVRISIPARSELIFFLLPDTKPVFFVDN